ncbi:MAG: hypothetical protein Q7V40_06415 [Pseudolabrys sp.]|nr:hypothetical protein [Pseudolabrys sp.]
MSKARKNTAKKASKPSTGIAALRTIVAEMVKLRAAANAAHIRYAEADLAFFKVRPAQPKSPEMPADLRAAFDNITVAQFRVLPSDHPYAVWQRESGATDKAAMAEYQTACANCRVECGLVAASTAVNRANRALMRAGAKAMKIAATGIEAIALKVRALRLANYDFETDQFDRLLATIDATAHAAGFPTKA